jgi:hypothetical protein
MPAIHAASKSLRGRRRSMPNICGHDAHCPGGSARTDPPARSGVDGATRPVLGPSPGSPLGGPCAQLRRRSWSWLGVSATGARSRFSSRAPGCQAGGSGRPAAGTRARRGTCRSCPLSRSPGGSAAPLPSSLVATSATPSTLATSPPGAPRSLARISEERRRRRMPRACSSPGPRSTASSGHVIVNATATPSTANSLGQEPDGVAVAACCHGDTRANTDKTADKNLRS